MIVQCTRKIDYLRISITDRCNLRCVYCMPPQGIETFLQKELLTFEEIIRLAKIFVSLGVKKIRLTGGEPLVRKGIVNLIAALNSIEGIEEVLLTTNSTLLSFYAEELKKAGLRQINISLDTLKPEKFRMITGRDAFFNVLEGIKAAKQEGFSLKLNVVVMKGINDDEIIDFVNFALDNKLILRFIEFMKITPLWRQNYFLPIQEVKKICEKIFGLTKIESLGSGPAEYYRVEENGIIGFINTKEDNCRRCTRLRLTSCGELKICLYENNGLCLKVLLRDGFSDSEIADIIKSRIEIKREIDYRHWDSRQFYMSSVGG